MSTAKILVYGKQPEILATVLRLINKEETWQGEGHHDEEQVIELFTQKQYDLFLLGGGISEESERKVRALFQRQQPDTPIVQHYGGGSGLLRTEIVSNLQSKQPAWQVSDNPFGA